MFQIFNNLFRSRDKKTVSDNSVEEETMEKKKCKRCLRRIEFEYSKCPFCGCSEFQDY